jgi:hypothetical protein
MAVIEIEHPGGGWYAVEGHESYHGSDHPRYLRALALTSGSDGERIRAVLRYVERDTPWIVRKFRDWRWSA